MCSGHLDISHATGGVFPSLGGVAFSTHGDHIHGSVHILVDPVTHCHGRKPMCGKSELVVDASHP